jgi:hypothetical protein
VYCATTERRRENDMNANDFVQSMQSLGTRYLEEYTRILQRYADFVGSVSSPSRGGGERIEPADLGAMQKRYADFVVSEAPRVLAQLSEAHLNYYSALADVGLRTLNGYVDSVVRTVGTSPRPGAGAPGNGGANALLFHGVRGQSASNAFLVTNNRDEAIDVEFNIAQVTGRDDQAPFKPKAKFTPEKCRLAPHTNRVIQCTMPLTGEFAAGQRYSGSITVVGYPEMAMRISVEVEESSEPAAGAALAAEPTAAKKPAKKRAAKKRKT